MTESWRQRLGDDRELGTIAGYRDHFETHMKARRMSKATIYRYLLAADQLDAYLRSMGLTTDVGLLGRHEIEKYLAWAAEIGTAPTTVNGRYNALVQFFVFVALELDPVPYVSPMAGMTPPAFEPPRIEIIPDLIVRAMLAQCEGSHQRRHTFEEIRDAALIHLFKDTGARLAEITGMTMVDLLEGDLVRLWGKSKGRGPVERHVPYGEATGRALRRYLRARSNHPQAASDRVWLGLKGPMTTSGVRRMVWVRSERAGLRIHPHQFRHTFAHAWKSDPRRKDGDLKYLAGWRTDAMVDRYGKAADASRAIEAYRSLGPPTA